ncbi:MAG: pucC: xanthine dehydrogenase subunit [Firmicutes bacterium]|nr:pucC: xanthine dehydrogenase subunit [Bacillota bacterium]
MFTISTIAQPDTLEAAYKVLKEKRSNAVLGGCAYLRMGTQKIHTGVDLTKLGLKYIKEQDNCIEIGAMTSFRDVETNQVLNKYAGGLLAKAVAGIIGVQFRNAVTVGASVFMRYGFSDFLTALLALDAEVELVQGGRMTLAAFLDMPRSKDVLTKVIIHKTEGQASYQALRNSAGDYPLVTVAVSRLNNEWKIVVGARPTRAKLAGRAAALLNEAGTLLGAELAEQAAQTAADELPFGSNRRASAAYRQAVAQTLIKRAIMEVAACK